MSNYTKTTDFGAKDSLPTGDSGKIIRGTEFETEFDAISTAIATKADIAGPTFTGTLTYETISDGTISITAFVDEDDMSSNSANLVPTQQSVKAYVDSQVTAQDLDFQADSGGALSIDLDSETMTFTGGTGIDTSGSGNAVTFAIDSTVATLTGTQTLTNKTLTSPVLNTGVSGTAVLDEDDMSSNSATQLATQQSIKAYVDSQVGANNELSEILANGNTTGGTNIVFGDSASVSDDRLVFGAGSDLQIYHSGTHSYIDDAGTGNLTLRGNASVRVEKYEGEILADFAADGAVSLYHDNSVKIATTSTGVSVTGNVAVSGTVDGRDVATDGSKLDGIEAGATGDQTNAEIRAAVEAATDSNVFTDADHSKLDGIEALADVTDTTNVTAAGALMDSELTNITAVKSLDQGVATTDSPTFAGLTTTADVSFGDNDKAVFGAGSDLQIYHNGNHSYITDTGAGNLYLGGSDLVWLGSGDLNETYATFNDDGAVTLRHDNSQKLATTATGIDVTGTVTSTSYGSQLATTLFEQNVLKSSVTASSGAFVRMAVSSASNPTYAFEDDTDTGVFTSGANTLNFGTAGTERLRIESGGDISFYEDTGTTAKFSWSSSNETIAIGTGASSTATISAFSRTVSANLPSALRIIENTGASSYWDIGANNGSSPNLNFYVNANTTPKVTFASSGNVGIGTSSPSSALHVDSSNDGPIFDSGGTGNTNHALLVRDSANSQLLRVNNNGNVGIGTTAPREKIHLHGGINSTQLLMTGGGLNSEIYGGFIEGDGVSGQGGHLRLGVLDAGTERVGIEIEEQGNQITFDTAGTERMRIDSSGNLLVGKTDTTFNTAGIALRSTDVLQVTRSGDTALELNRTSNDGKLAEFYRSGVSVGSIGVQVGGLEIDGNPSATTTLRFGTSSTIYPATDNAGDIGASGNRFKDLYLSSGIHANNAFQRWKAVDNNGGSGIFSTITNGEPQTGFLYAYETGTEKYIIAALFKEDESSVVTTTQIANNGLTVNATNAGGTIALAGATTASNVRMQAVTIKRS